MSGIKPFNWRSLERVFLTTPPTPCPYLPHRAEQKLVTRIHPGDSQDYAALSEQGFRRSHDAAYQPSCPTCKACQALRVLAADFKPNKTQRRLQRAYAHLHLSLEGSEALDEHWALFQAYIKGRHAAGSMASMTRADFKSMVGETPIETKLLSWHDGPDGPLLAACLCDVLPSGLSAVYSYFSLRPQTPSLGTFIILALIDLARRADMAHVHLGYWVKGSQTMDYKARFTPAEVCVDGVWRPLSKSP